MRSIISALALCASLSVLTAAQTRPAPARPPVRTPVAPATNEPTAIIHTTVGDMHCRLFEKQAPIGVANFIGLADGTKDWTSPISHAKKHGVPLYDGTIFHRVIPEFMIQGGDPAGTGMGDPGYAFKNEVSPNLKFDHAGRLAYANSGPDTNGSQFFITEVALTGRQAELLDGHYTIFGQCDPATVELVKKIARMTTDPATDHRPFHPVKITHIEIQRGAAPAAKPPAVRTPAKSAGTKKTQQ
jgi:peptidyl-prolyl cis-trans isomerase A (cyclophilin A)